MLNSNKEKVPRQNVVILSDNTVLKKKDAKVIERFLEDYGEVESFVACSSLIDFKHSLLRLFDPDITEKNLGVGRGERPIISLVASCDTPIVIFAQDYCSSFYNVISKVMWQNRDSIVMMVGRKDKEADDVIKKEAYASCVDYISPEGDVASNIIHTLAKRLVDQKSVEYIGQGRK